MKFWLKKIYSSYFRFKHRNVAVIGKNCVFGFKSRIINKTGKKNAIHICDGVMMHGNLIVEGEGKIRLEKGVNIRRNTYIGSINKVVINEGTIISDSVTIMDNNNHPVSIEERVLMVESGWSGNAWSWIHSDSKPITIGRNVWLCQGSRILKGVTIHDGSIVAADAVVSKSANCSVVLAGNPAVVVKNIK